MLQIPSLRDVRSVGGSLKTLSKKMHGQVPLGGLNYDQPIMDRHATSRHVKFACPFYPLYYASSRHVLHTARRHLGKNRHLAQ